MKAVKNDLNFFKAYKLGPGKHTEKSMRGIIILFCCLILSVASIFSIFFTMRIQVNKQADGIRAELALPEVAALQEKLNAANAKKGLLSSYKGIIKNAQQNFEKSNIFDSDLFNDLEKSMPQTSTITNLSLSPQSLQIVCATTNRLDPAYLKQALMAKKRFSGITYNGVTRGAEGIYTFSMSCEFGEGAVEE
ncbi:MAG: hypothetical protein LBS36_03550 [Oscillospiraceae bacterium]|jgi:hypothetical protein|nr:hypothetical protein [Oscillospiraceae bacterium]